MLQPPRIALLFACLHALLYLLLSLRVVLHRRSARIGVGTGGDPALTRKVRVHANFAEYVPLALLMLALLELVGSPARLLWIFGAALLLGRVLHAWGLGGSAGASAGRLWGTALTWAVLLAMAVAGLYRHALEMAL
jgi:uncharacterized membrane protein YecN with MAPEG domain